MIVYVLLGAYSIGEGESAINFYKGDVIKHETLIELMSEYNFVQVDVRHLK